MFRLFIDQRVVGESLTAVQTHVLVGEALDRITVPRPATREPERDKQQRLRGPGIKGSELTWSPMTLKSVTFCAAVAAGFVSVPADAQKLRPGQVYLYAVNPMFMQRLEAMQRYCHDNNGSNYEIVCAPVDKVEAVLGGFGWIRLQVVDDPRGRARYTWGCPRQAVDQVRQLDVEKSLSASSASAPTSAVEALPPISALYAHQNMDYRSMTGEELLQIHHVLDEWCRGAPGGSALSDGACDERNRLDGALYAKGYCHVGMGSSGRFEKGPSSKWRK
jgi:hypothetical protein